MDKKIKSIKNNKINKKRKIKTGGVEPAGV